MFSDLDDKGLVLEARREAQHAHVRRLVDEVLDAVENSTTGGRDTAMDSSLADGFSGHACMGVDVLQTQWKQGYIRGPETVHKYKEYFQCLCNCTWSLSC